MPFTETESRRRMVPGAEGGGSGQSLGGVSVWEDEKVLEMAGA